MTAKRARKTRSAELLPVIPLRSTTVYPYGVIGVQIGIPSTLEMLSAHTEANLVVAVVVAPGGPDDPIEARGLAKVGVRARVSDRLNMPGGTVQLTLQGLERLMLDQVSVENGHFIARARPLPDIVPPEDVTQELIARILNALEILSVEVERVPREIPRILRMNLADPGRFADLVATLANFSVDDKDAVTQRIDVGERLRYALEQLEHELSRVRQIAVDATAPEKDAAETEAPPQTPAERAAELRQRIKMLQAQLGDVDPVEREVIETMRRIETTDMPGRIAAAARTEVERLRTVGGVGPEASEIRSYVDWLINVPWRRAATGGPGAIDLAAVEASLDRALLGLVEQKDRLLTWPLRSSAATSAVPFPALSVRLTSARRHS
jgi:ATP-dependent Lon protease